MKKIREGNDISVTWIIMQDELTPLNTEDIHEERLFLVWGKSRRRSTPA